MNLIEVFATLLCDRTSSLWNVNKVRKEVFSRKGRSLPPSQASLIQPVKTAVSPLYLVPLLDGNGSLKIVTGFLTGQHFPKKGLLLWTHLIGYKCQKASLTCTGLCNCGGSCPKFKSKEKPYKLAIERPVPGNFHNNHMYSIDDACEKHMYSKANSHRILVSKLRDVDINPYILNWLISFISNRKKRVVVDNIVTEYIDITRGVPQGTVLGPILFLWW